VRRTAAELVARGDIELQEDLAHVVLHRSRADEQLRADLGVGEAIAGEPSDLRLLGCEVGACFVGVSPVAASSRRARSANPSIPM
jgi:hypothetical protein